MKPILKSLLLAATALAVHQTHAITVLDFEGLGNLEPVENFYNGGLGGNGSGPGPNYGVTFNGNALAIIDDDVPGGTGNFGGEPSPSTVLFFLTGSATMTLASGFDTGFSFYYSAVNQPGVITVYDGPDATGNVLATLNLPVTVSDGGDPNGNFSPFFPIGVAFAGTAQSIDFGGTVNQIGFDNITFGSDTPQPPPSVPEAGTSVALLGLGMAGLTVLRRKLS